MKAEAQLGQQQPGQQYPSQQPGQYPGQNQGYSGPQQIVVVNQTVIEPPCCGTLCVSINDFFWLWGPTGLSFAVVGRMGGFAVITVLGFIAHFLAIGSAICSCGVPSSGKVAFMNFYKWFRLAWFILYLIGAIIIIIIGAIIMNSKATGDFDSALRKAFGIVVIILGVIIAIPGIIMASTHGCFSRDLGIKKQAIATGTPTF